MLITLKLIYWRRTQQRHDAIKPNLLMTDYFLLNVTHIGEKIMGVPQWGTKFLQYQIKLDKTKLMF